MDSYLKKIIDNWGAVKMDSEEIIEGLESKIKGLLARAWKDSDLNLAQVKSWYSQFNKDHNPLKNEQVQFLFLLSHFMYFGKNEIQEMLRSIFRDLYKYPTIHHIRKQYSDTLDEDFLNGKFEEDLKKTRFLGIGNPSESGPYLLYRFRQINELPKKLFINCSDAFKYVETKGANGRDRLDVKIADGDVKNYIFIDDITCSGSQAHAYSLNEIAAIKKLNPQAKVYYFVLIATENAIEFLQNNTVFDGVDAVFKLDGSFKCFEFDSRYYQNENSLEYDREFTRDMCKKYDKLLAGEKYELGFQQSQLLLSFEHNTPDNVPPVFWSDGSITKQWKSPYKRYHKKYK